MKILSIVSLFASIIYLILPIDAIPDAIPIAGQIDDLLLMAIPGILYLISEKIEEKSNNDL